MKKNGYNIHKLFNITAYHLCLKRSGMTRFGVLSSCDLGIEGSFLISSNLEDTLLSIALVNSRNRAVMMLSILSLSISDLGSPFFISWSYSLAFLAISEFRLDISSRVFVLRAMTLSVTVYLRRSGCGDGFLGGCTSKLNVSEQGFTLRPGVVGLCPTDTGESGSDSIFGSSISLLCMLFESSIDWLIYGISIQRLLPTAQYFLAYFRLLAYESPCSIVYFVLLRMEEPANTHDVNCLDRIVHGLKDIHYTIV